MRSGPSTPGIKGVGKMNELEFRTHMRDRHGVNNGPGRTTEDLKQQHTMHHGMSRYGFAHSHPDVEEGRIGT